MRISELQLTNYRAFKDPAPFKFGKNFSVIAGVNGKGKTAILDGLALLFSRLLPLVSPARSGYRRIDPSEVYFGESYSKLSMKVNCAGIPILYGLSYEKETGKIKATHLAATLKKHVRLIYDDPGRADDAAPLVVYYTTDRAGYRLPKKLPTEVPKGQAAAYKGALFNRTVNFRDFMARYRVLAGEECGKNPHYLGARPADAIAATVGKFLEGFQNLRVEENPLRLLIDKQGVALNLSQLSDGERSFIALVSDLGRRLALANPLLENPLNGAGVVLIDELELHLHPKWQLEVVEKLRAAFPNIQFIVTTHSPFILQTAREGEVIKLDGDLTVVPAGRTLEEVSRLVMDVTNTDQSPRYREMLDTARKYLRLAEEAKAAPGARREQIQNELVKMLAPFTDNPAYTALLERRGVISPEA